MRALIDADIIAYSVGFAADSIYYMLGKKRFKYKSKANAWCDRHGHDRELIVKYHEPGDLEETLKGVDGLVGDIIEATDANEASLYLTGERNYRETIAVSLPYKGNRDKGHKPHHYAQIRDHLINEWGAILVEGQEADDALGIAQVTSQNTGKDTVICSIDKDLLMIPGLHYNWVKDEWNDIDEHQGWYNFYKQMLTGDKADNIGGIPGVGEQTAKHILAGLEVEEMQKAVGLQYAKHFDDPEARMLENAHLLWIRREEDQMFNFNIHEDE